jgi:hypothetical protein
MPKSKHRRKSGGKAVAHPGRGKPGRSLSLDFEWPEGAPAQRVDDIADLPLFDWTAAEGAEEEEKKEVG